MFSKRQALILNLLQQTKPKERTALIKSVDRDILKLLVEMSHNTLKGNVPLNATQFKNIRKYKHYLRFLSDKTIPLEEKRNYLVTHQSGGFLPILLPIVASAVGGLLGKIWNK